MTNKQTMTNIQIKNNAEIIWPEVTQLGWAYTSSPLFLPLKSALNIIRT